MLACITGVARAEGLDSSQDYSYGAAAEPRARLDLRPQATPGAPPTTIQRALALRGRAASADAPPQAEPVAAAPSQSDQTRPTWLQEERVGAPYQAHGAWYVPTAEPGYSETGLASWYGERFHGRPTASGEAFDQNSLSAAHPTLPLPSLVQVTNLANGAEVIVRVNDRGPFTQGRIIDVSKRAADVLGFTQAGQARVHVRYLGPAPRRVGDGAEPAAAPASQRAPTTRPQTRAAVGETNGYVVQVGAFGARANAERAVARVQDAGPAAIRVSERGARAVHKVQLGPWRTRQEAVAAQARVAGLGFDDAMIVAVSAR